ncbi:MAG: magnesium/cobalt efflux protein, partial [Kordiimonadaceae bacterium]|nr:magnesium/cobalt efflux protein [Kordiimonadaceae bacterium]
EIEEMEKVLGVDILPEAQDEDVATLGGLVFTLAGRVPEIGEVILHETGYKFEILDADPRSVSKVRIHPPVKE